MMTEQTEKEMDEKDAAYWTENRKIFHAVLSAVENRKYVDEEINEGREIKSIKKKLEILCELIAFLIETETLADDQEDTVEGVIGLIKWHLVHEPPSD